MSLTQITLKKSKNMREQVNYWVGLLKVLLACMQCVMEIETTKLWVRLGLVLPNTVNSSIAFGHVLSRYTSDPEILEDPEAFEYDHESIISLELFERWLKHPDFCMVN